MICRLCLQTIGNKNCRPVEESLLKFLKLNKNLCKENVMCIECTNRLQVFSNFTSNCVYTGDGTLPLSDIDNDIKLEPEAIETKTNPQLLMEVEIKCSFCTQTHGREDLISLKESKEHKFLVNKLEQYISESYLKNTKEFMTCKTCLGELQSGLNVILKCLEVEEKLSKYIDLEGTDDKGQVELRDVQQFTFKPILKSEIGSFCVDELKGRSDRAQEEYAEMAEAKIKYEKEINDTELIIKMEDTDIKKFEQDDCDITDIKSEQSLCGGFQEPFIEIKSPSEIKDCLTRHLSIHKTPSQKKIIKCELCSYETKRKSSLKQHLFTHKSPSEIKMFNCTSCPYKTKYICNIQRHLLTHKSPSEIKMFKCELCSYEGKQKGSLKRHLLTHKNPSEIQIFKCELCPYETEIKANFFQHLLIHESRQELKMFI